MKDFRTTTPKDCKIGDIIDFINVPSNSTDMRLSWYQLTITKIEYTSSGKRLKVTFDNGYRTGLMADNTPFEISPMTWWDSIIKERGFKN
jgi:hypothetical protein